MNNIEIIYGKEHEGKTNEIVEKYVNYCNGKTIIDGKEYKNSDLVKPIFIYKKETLEELKEIIKSKDNNFDFTDKIFNYYLDTENVLTYEKLVDISKTITGGKVDLIIFLDINVRYEDLPDIIKHILHLNSKDLTMDFLISAYDIKTSEELFKNDLKLNYWGKCCDESNDD